MRGGIMEQNSIVVKNVTKKFDDFMLDHISFTVPTGRIVGFIGENGAGKSTTINLILDQLKLDAGEIRILGKQNHSYLHKDTIVNVIRSQAILNRLDTISAQEKEVPLKWEIILGRNRYLDPICQQT